MSRKALQVAKEFENDLLQFTREIIAIPSFSGKEEKVVRRIANEMERLGYDEVRIDGLGNVLGRVGSGPKVLAIDGHCDTVGVGNPDLWRVDPFAAEVKDGILYGRGASDQKSGVASAVYAGRLLRELGVPDGLTLWVVASVQEEDCEGLPWKFIIEEDGLKPDAVLLTEPTNLNIYRGHRGRLEIKVQTEGISCHGSAPERGVNAIYRMAPIVQEIAELHARLADDPFLGKGSVAVTDIRSTSPSLCAVPDSCTIHLDRRLTAGETIESSLREVEELPAFRKAEARAWVPEYAAPSWTDRTYPMQSYFPTWVLPEKHPLLHTAVSVYRKLFGEEPAVGKWTFSTNGVATMGLYGIPTFGFGPGNEVHAHSPEDQVPVAHLPRAAAFYAQFAREFGAG